jgi:hypothetical protein
VNDAASRSSEPAPARRPRLAAQYAAAAAVDGRAMRSLACAFAAGAAAVTIHFAWLPAWSYLTLRNWGLHFFALVAASVLTTSLLGYHGAGRRQRTLLRLGCGVPLAITLLHELGQWVWPAGARDHFDSVRDSALNVAGVVVGWWILRRHGGGGANT